VPHSFQHILSILALSGSLLTASAQPLQTVSGTITDNRTKEPLTGASISLSDREKFFGGITDDAGNFTIENVPVGKYAAKVSFIGYEPLMIAEMEIAEGNSELLSFSLGESTTEINEVVVQGSKKENDEAQNPMAVASARSFTIETAERFAASMRDPSRLALSFAGVRGQSDILNGIIVRGNAPKGVMWRVEGIEVPSPNHFSQEGFGGGAVCLISGQVIGTSDFYTGAFPAEFGNTMSAVFDVKLRKGDTLRRHYYMQAGMLGFEGGLEGPFLSGKRSSYLINYRYSTLKLFDKIGFPVGNTITTYQDLNFKLNFPTKRAGTFSIFGIGGMSEINIKEQKKKKLKDKTKTYDMALAGVSHSYSLNEKTHLVSIVAFAANRESLDKDEIYTGNVLVPSYRLAASNMFIRGTVELNTRFSPRSSLRSGVIASGIRFKVDDLYDALLRTGEVKTAELTFMTQAHSQWKYLLSEKWTLTTGLHFLFFGYNHHYSIEPRMGIAWQFSKKQSLYLAAGLHSKLESLACYTVQDPWSLEQPNRGLDFTKSAQVVLGYEIKPVADLMLKAESYFQYHYDVPISTDEGSYFSMLNFQDRYVTMQLVNNGLGMNYGIELTLEKSFSRNYYLLANGSLFNSKYYAADGIWRNSRYNSHFITSLSAGKDFPFGKIKAWTFGANARVLWSGGERTEDTQFEEQIGNYFRFDTRVSIARKREHAKWILAIDIQNSTNRLNETTLDEIDPTGILPVLSFRVEL